MICVVVYFKYYYDDIPVIALCQYNKANTAFDTYLNENETEKVVMIFDIISIILPVKITLHQI